MVTAANAAQLTMSDVYARFPTSDAKRDAFLQEVARGGDRRTCCRARASARGRSRARSVARPVNAGCVYSATRPSRRCSRRRRSAARSRRAPGPYVGVFVNRGSASKLDYYLDAVGRLRARAVPRRSHARLDRHAAPEEHRAGERAVHLRDGPARTPTGAISHLDLMAVHLPVGARCAPATLDGKPLAVSPHTLLGRPVVTFPVRLDAGQERTVVLELHRAARARSSPRLEVQALAKPARTSATSAVSCA